MKTPTYLVCAPTHYEVSYVINPWMNPGEWQAHKAEWTAKAQHQWQALVHTIQHLGWGLTEIVGARGLPDMVFAANHGFVIDKKMIISRFCTDERAGETPLIADWCAQNGFEPIKSKFTFEGGGDALYDPYTDIIWLGYGYRSSALIAPELERIYGKRVITLAQNNAYFYHLDTSFCPLMNGWAMLTTSAFTSDALHAIKAVYGDKLIMVSDDDAKHFACNAVVHEKNIVMPKVSAALTEQLAKLGFTTHQLELDSYILAGGASRCLTLKLTD